MKKKQVNRNLTIYRPSAPKYPNAADNAYFVQKAVDILTSIVSGMGIICAMLFLLTMN